MSERIYVGADHAGFELKQKLVAELKRLYLRESARGKGVGRMLLDRFLAWAEANRCERAIIWSDKRFTDAHRLYGKMGFQVMADRVFDPAFLASLETAAR